MKKMFLAFAMLLMLVACDEAPDYEQSAVSSEAYGGRGAASMKLMAAPAPAMMDGAMAQANPAGMVLDRSTLGDRRIAETHHLGIETKFDELQARYQADYKKCVELGCEIFNSDIAGETRANINARIDPQRLAAFLEYLAEGPGKIKNHSVSADDYTMEYSDVTAQNENLIALRARLRQLLTAQQTTEVSDILEIEQELARVQTEIDTRAARLRILDKMTQMATVNINYSVEYRPAEVRPYELKNTWKRATQRFLMGVDRMIQFIGGVLPWIPVFFVGFWLGVRMIRLAFGKINWRWPWRKG